MVEKKLVLFNRKSINISNFLSISRVFIAVLMIVFLVKGYNIWLIFLLGVIAALTDVFDGYFARKLNQITELGKILDPVADKITIICLVIVLIYLRGFPVWLVILIALRDLILLLGGLLVIGKLKYVISSNIPGKVTANVLALLIASYIIDLKFIQDYLVVLSSFLIVISLISYCFIY
ncbi:hypothetical protein DRQ09_05890, partial [candidate division KSB1 bacterium]